MECPHHKVELVVGPGKLICPEAGCCEHAALPVEPKTESKDERKKREADEKAKTESQAKMEAEVKELHANQ